MTKPVTHPGLAEALKATGSSRRELAKLIGCSPSLVTYWERNGLPISAKYVLQAELKLGVSRHKLNPEIYPPGVKA